MTTAPQAALADANVGTTALQHDFQRPEGLTYRLCTRCGVTIGTPWENEARACDPTRKRKQVHEPALVGRPKAFTAEGF